MREAVELGARGDLLEVGAIEVDEEEIEVAAMRVAVVRREDAFITQISILLGRTMCCARSER